MSHLLPAIVGWLTWTVTRSVRQFDRKTEFPEFQQTFTALLTRAGVHHRLTREKLQRSEHRTSIETDQRILKKN